jgi:hypothetical protein
LETIQLNEIQETKKKLELLKLARNLLNEEYVKARADEYSQWVRDCDAAWREQGIKLPYPALPPMPSESDVVARALKLYNYINAAEKPVLSTAETSVVSGLTPESVAMPINTNLPVPEVTPVTYAPATLPDPVPVVVPEPVAVPEPVVVPEPVAAPESVAAPEPVAEVDPEPAAVAEPEVMTPAEIEANVQSYQPANPQSVTTLIKGLLKKGLLPNWTTPDGPRRQEAGS